MADRDLFPIVAKYLDDSGLKKTLKTLQKETKLESVCGKLLIS